MGGLGGSYPLLQCFKLIAFLCPQMGIGVLQVAVYEGMRCGFIFVEVIHYKKDMGRLEDGL